MPNTTDKIIRRLDVSDTSTPDLHEFAAKYIYSLENGSPVEHSWEDIKALIDAGIELVTLNKLPPANLSAYNDYKGKIVLIPSTNPQTQNEKDEYIIQRTGTDPNYTYAWEQIGSTTVDLSNYVQKGTYTTQGASGNTGAGGAATITTSSSGSQSAVGTATITYDKATSIDSHSIAAHSHTVNPTKETLTYISGVKQTGGTTNVVTSVGANGTVSAVTGITTTTTSVVTSVEVGSTVSVVKNAIKDVTLGTSTTSSTGAIAYIDGITGSTPALGGETSFVKGITNFSGGSLTGTKTFNTDAIKSASLNGDTSFFKNATVVDGVLSFGKGTVGITTSAASTGTVGFSGATFGLSKDTVTISGGSYTATTKKYLKATGVAADDKADVVTGVTVGGTTNVINSVSVNGTSTVLTGVKATGTATVILNTGLISSTVDIMTGAILSTNGATTLSHNINHTSTTVTGSVEVAVSDHTHTVTIENHTHSLGNHTHNITFS